MLTLRGNRFLPSAQGDGSWSADDPVFQLLGRGNVIDARWNWWGTTDGARIESTALDESEDASGARVRFEPWLTHDDQAGGWTAVERMGWGRLKRWIATP